MNRIELENKIEQTKNDLSTLVKQLDKFPKLWKKQTGSVFVYKDTPFQYLLIEGLEDIWYVTWWENNVPKLLRYSAESVDLCIEKGFWKLVKFVEFGQIY